MIIWALCLWSVSVIQFTLVGPFRLSCDKSPDLSNNVNKNAPPISKSPSSPSAPSHGLRESLIIPITIVTRTSGEEEPETGTFLLLDKLIQNKINNLIKGQSVQYNDEEMTALLHETPKLRWDDPRTETRVHSRLAKEHTEWISLINGHLLLIPHLVLAQSGLWWRNLWRIFLRPPHHHHYHHKVAGRKSLWVSSPPVSVEFITKLNWTELCWGAARLGIRPIQSLCER